jgi:hypothetical protein
MTRRKPRKSASTGAYTGDWPLPKVIVLPGMRVRVRVVPHADMQGRGVDYGAFVYTALTADIFISDKWPLEVQRYILWHELQHAVVEGLDTMIELYPQFVQTDQMNQIGKVTEWRTVPTDPAASPPSADAVSVA